VLDILGWSIFLIISQVISSEILALAEQHNCHGIKEACFAFLSSSSALDAVMETDGFEYLTSSCPRVVKELMSKLVAR
jgi:speckle-type POZ protein